MAEPTNKKDIDNLLKSTIKLQEKLEGARSEYEKLSEVQKKTVEGQKKYVDLLEIEKQKLEALIKLNERKGESIVEEEKTLKEILKSIKEANTQYSEMVKLQKEIEGLTKSFVEDINGALGLVNDLNQTGFGKTWKLIEKSRRNV